ncbi:MAG TPA: hypothetical protein PKL44_02300 [Candidatus Dojkabacteria bacterium]|nr:hypothetical protein [Candidatus Dojkabacteria bacterium]
MQKNKNFKILFSIIFLIFMSLVFGDNIFACPDYQVSTRTCWCSGCNTYYAWCRHTSSDALGNCLYTPDPLSKQVAGTLNGGTSNCKNAWATWFPSCGGGGGGGGCSFESCTDCTLPTCSAANGGNPDYTTNKPVDAEGNTIASPLAACIGNSISCNGKDNCGDSCNPQGPYACYLPETNLNTIPTPAWNRLKIGVLTSPNLSTNSSSKTLVHYPLPGVTISSETQQIANPTGSRELRYNFLIDATAPAIAQTSNELLGKPLLANLTQGYEGSIRTNYQTLNKCNDSVRSGSTLTTYYKVNTLPVVTSLTISGESGDNITTRGCTATASYTGKEANNPLIITIKGTDANDTNSINGAYLWMVKEGTTIPAGYLDKRYSVGPGQTDTKPEIIGLFLAHSSTSDSVSIYKSINDNSTGTLSGWGRDTHDGTSGGIPNMDVMDRDPSNPANNKMLIQDFEILQHEVIGGEFTFKIKLPFPTDSLGPISGNYKFYAGMTDNLSYYSIPGAGTYVELRTNQLTTQPSWQWNFDFINPLINSYTLTVPDVNQREVDLSWVNDGTGSNIKDTVVNVYINPDSEIQVKRLNPLGGLINTIEKPGANAIGLITPPVVSGWYNNSSVQISNIDIGDNSSGIMSFFTTIYDQACNYYITNSDTTREYNLDKWIATKGGIFYSEDVISFVPKDIEPYNLGTELITTTKNYPQVNSFSDLMNPVIVRSIKDSNDTNSSSRFDFLLGRYNKMVEESAFTPIGNLTCPAGEKCIFSTSSIGIDGVVTIYSGKIMVISDGDINIYPDIVATNPATDGLIVFSGGTIRIVGANRKSNDVSLRTDRIEAMMIAKNGITITKESLNPSDQQDRVEIQGSLIGFGADNTGTSVLVERNLGLQNINYPVLNVMYHPKYAKLSELFFGTDTTTYKQEVGFKF